MRLRELPQQHRQRHRAELEEIQTYHFAGGGKNVMVLTTWHSILPRRTKQIMSSRGGGGAAASAASSGHTAYYERLGLTREATLADVRKAFFVRAKRVRRSVAEIRVADCRNNGAPGGTRAARAALFRLHGDATENELPNGAAHRARQTPVFLSAFIWLARHCPANVFCAAARCIVGATSPNRATIILRPCDLSASTAAAVL